MQGVRASERLGGSFCVITDENPCQPAAPGFLPLSVPISCL